MIPTSRANDRHSLGLFHHLGSPQWFWIFFFYFDLSNGLRHPTLTHTLSISLLHESFHLVICLQLRLFPGTGASNVLHSRPTCPSSLLLTCPYRCSIFFVIFFVTRTTFTDPLTSWARDDNSSDWTVVAIIPEGDTKSVTIVLKNAALNWIRDTQCEVWEYLESNATIQCHIHQERMWFPSSYWDFRQPYALWYCHFCPLFDVVHVLVPWLTASSPSLHVGPTRLLLF